MKPRTTVFFFLLAFTTMFAAETSTLDSRPSPPSFQELYDLLRKNLTGVTEAELDHAAAQGLIKQLYPLVSLVTNAGGASSASGLPTLHSSLFEGAYAYFRFHEIVEGVDKEFSTAQRRIASTNRLRGLIVDLRFAQGNDYAAAAAIADLFLPPRQPMIDWGEGLKLSTAKTNAPGGSGGASSASPINLPIAILINKETRGAAEAFAAILRRSDIGLLLGDNTAGQAFITRDFPLKNGQKLTIATTPVKIAFGGSGPATPILRNGLPPDIKVEVALADERAFLQDPYRPVPRFAAGASFGGPNSTNQTAAFGTNRNRRRINEAELVRMQREGIDLDSEFPTGREAGPLRPPVITDPVLARALDLLKGLSVVHQFRGSDSR